MKDIMLRIIGRSLVGEEAEDQMEFVTEGKFYEKGDTMYIIYEESELSGMPGCKTSLRVQSGNVRMKRFGNGAGSDTIMEFHKGKRTEGLYDTPFGSFEMELLTNDIRSTLSRDGNGTVDIDYHISLKGLSEGRSLLNIEILPPALLEGEPQESDYH